MKLMNVLSVVVSTALCTGATRAQSSWFQQNPLPTGNNLRGVCFADAYRGVAVGECGLILRTTDGGATWTPQQSGTASSLFAVTFSDANRGTVVGEPPSTTQSLAPATILNTTDGGLTWTIQQSPARTALLGVCFFDASTGTAVGDSGAIIHTTNGGLDWIAQTSGTTEPLRGVSFSDSHNGTAIGGHCEWQWWSCVGVNVILRTVDGGASWVAQIPGTSASLNGVCFTDSLTGTVVGENGVILRTNDAGTTWLSQQSGTTATLTSVYFTDKSNGTVVGANGTILHTTDGGENWTGQTSNVTIPLTSVCFTDSRTGMVVGDGGCLLRTVDGGGLWIGLGPKGTLADLSGVSFSTANTGVVLGFDARQALATILRTTDGGAHWDTRWSNGQVRLHGVTLVGGNKGFAVGSYNAGGQYGPSGGIILCTTDDGVSWYTQDMGGTNFHAVNFTDPSNGTVVGDFAGGLILHTTDGGVSWRDHTGILRRNLVAVSFSDSNFGTAVGDGGTILRTTDGGFNWREQASNLEFGLRDVCFSSRNTGTIVGELGTVLRTTNGGIAWLNQDGRSGYDWTGVSFADSIHGAAIGNQHYFGGGIEQGAKIIRTIDGGNTWTTTWADVGIEVRGISLSSCSFGIAVGRGLMLRTTDGGATWLRQAAPQFDCRAVSFFDSLNGYIIGRRSVLSTHDGGSNWMTSTLSFQPRRIACKGPLSAIAVGEWGIAGTTDGGATWASQGAGNLSGVSFPGPKYGVAVGQNGTVLRTTDGGDIWTSLSKSETYTGVSFVNAYIGTVVGGGSILRTTDGGDTWYPQRSTPDEWLNGVFFTDERTGTVVGAKSDSAGQSHGLILRTTNGGEEWVCQYAEAGKGLTSVFFTDSLRGAVIGEGSILQTIDGGQTWKRQWSGTNRLNSVWLSDVSTGTVVGAYGTILRTTTGDVTSAGDEPSSRREKPQRFVLMQNYPNPFNPSTTIKYELPSTSNVILSVYDVLGREVRVLVHEKRAAGVQEVKFDASGLSSGVYFYRLQAGGFVETKKLLLLR